VSPTNGVGGLFILSLQGEEALPLNFISRARLAAARRAREMKLREASRFVWVGWI
jgi:hypothetical protein